MRPPARRIFLPLALAGASALLLAACTGGVDDAATPSSLPSPSTDDTTDASTDAATQTLLEAAAAEQVEARALASLLAEIRVDGRVVAQVALGEAMDGEAVTLDGRFRNGAVAITYASTLALLLAEEGVIDLDEPIARWLPGFPDAELATPRMLIDMTAGYPDHVPNPDFLAASVADPFRAWTNDELLAFSLGSPRLFAPGTNWDYSHSDYVVLGEVLEAATGSSMEELMAEYVLEPLGLDGTDASQTPAIPSPVVHAFTLERGIWEDSTFWNPSWTLPEGAVETSTISDVASSYDAIVGRGELLDDDSYEALIEPALVGFGEPVDGCRTCHTMSKDWSFGLGAILTGDWVKQTPLFGGYASSVLTLPESRSDDGRSVTIAVAVTYTQHSYDDWDAALQNYADQLALQLGAELVPGNPPPIPMPIG